MGIFQNMNQSPLFKKGFIDKQIAPPLKTRGYVAAEGPPRLWLGSRAPAAGTGPQVHAVSPALRAPGLRAPYPPHSHPPLHPRVCLALGSSAGLTRVCLQGTRTRTCVMICRPRVYILNNFEIRGPTDSGACPAHSHLHWGPWLTTKTPWPAWGQGRKL